MRAAPGHIARALLFNHMASLSALPLFNIWALDPNNATQAITSANTKAAAVYLAPKTGNISHVGTAFSAFSGAGTVDLRVETVSARLPSGTLKSANSNINYAPAATNTWVWSQLTAAAAVTAGDLIAAACVYVSGTSATIRYSANNLAPQFPYVTFATAGTYTTNNRIPMIGLKYNDGTIVRGGILASNLSTSGFNSGTNPNERATVFTPPFNCTLVGALWSGSVNASAAYTVNLYSGTNTTATATATVPADADRAAGGGGTFSVQFPSSVSLIANQPYRLSILATTVNSINLGFLTWLGTAERNASLGEATSDTRNGGAWLGETTTQSEMIVPLIDSVAAGGVLFNPGANGGLV